MENFDGKNSREYIPINTTFDATNEELVKQYNNEKKGRSKLDYSIVDTTGFTPGDYPFAHIKTPYLGISSYRVDNIKLKPLIGFSQLSLKGTEGNLITLKAKDEQEQLKEGTAGYEKKNPCNITPFDGDLGRIGSGKVADGQNHGKYKSMLAGLASFMRLMRNGKNGDGSYTYRNKSIQGLNCGGMQGFYKENEPDSLKALRITRITHACENLQVSPFDRLYTDDKETMMAFAQQTAIRETGCHFNRNTLNKAYTLAFPEEQGKRGVLYDYDGNLIYEGELLNGKEHGKGKKMESGKVYEGKWENGEFVEGKIYEKGKITAIVENGNIITVEEYVNSVNEKIKPVQEKLERTGGDKYWKGYRGDIEFKWDTTKDEQMIHSWNNDVILDGLTENKIKLKGLSLDLSFEEGIWLANFKNWVKRNYTGQTVEFGRDIINKNFDFDKTLKIGNTMLITRKDLESYIPRCSDDNIMVKLTKWLNK